MENHDNAKVNDNKEHVIDKLSKMPLPITILISVFILGVFYYAAEAKKINYQEAKEERLREEQIIRESTEIRIKATCNTEAEMSATENYKRVCEDTNKLVSYGKEDCNRGLYNIENRKSMYNQCLEKNGIK